MERAEIEGFLEEKGFTVDNNNLSKDIIKAYSGGTLITSFPFFKYPDGSNYDSLYPTLTQYLKNELPTLKNNSIIINAIQNYTSLTTAEISEDLQWGKGPTIKIVQLDNFCSTCDSLTYGLYDGINGPDILHIDVDLVNDIENSAGTVVGNSFAFLIGVTILHEYVHFGDNDGNDFPGEEGALFEVDAYGQTVWRTNAKIILKRYTLQHE